MNNFKSHDDYKYEDETRGFYGGMSDDEYEKKQRRSHILLLENTSLNLKQDLRILDKILKKYDVDAYSQEIHSQLNTQIITKTQEEKMLFEFAEYNFSFKTLQDACDQKIDFEMLLDRVEEELKELGERD